MAIGKYAFVVPRFEESIAGGAETLMAELAKRLHQRGDQIEILTTCALDHRTWENHFEPGWTEESGLKVCRFPVDQRDLDLWIPKQIQVSEGLMLPINDQLDWMQESVNSYDLYNYILENQDQYDLIFFGPYLFGTTFWGSLLAPEKSVLIPCLHDEAIAYTEVMQSMFRQVKKCMFNAKAEKDLAESLYGKLIGEEVGMGFDLIDPDHASEFKPYFDDSFPYVFYVGRKETGKNLHLLIEYFQNYKQACPESKLKLVIAGGGDIQDVCDPNILKSAEIIDLPKVSEEEKHRLIKYCNLLCQPSTNESFSIVLMEAWQFKKPVLVHANCPVTKEHVVESAGGLYFANQNEFTEALIEIESKQDLADNLGQAGYTYVKNIYNWDNILKRFDACITTINSHVS